MSQYLHKVFIPSSFFYHIHLKSTNFFLIESNSERVLVKSLRELFIYFLFTWNKIFKNLWV